MAQLTPKAVPEIGRNILEENTFEKIEAKIQLEDKGVSKSGKPFHVYLVISGIADVTGKFSSEMLARSFYKTLFDLVEGTERVAEKEDKNEGGS